MDKVLIYSRNVNFNGFRNAGRHSIQFREGIAEATSETASVCVSLYGYLCPKLFPEHSDTVLKLRAGKDSPLPSDPSEEPDASGESDDPPSDDSSDKPIREESVSVAEPKSGKSTLRKAKIK